MPLDALCDRDMASSKAIEDGSAESLVDRGVYAVGGDTGFQQAFGFAAASALIAAVIAFAAIPPRRPAPA